MLGKIQGFGQVSFQVSFNVLECGYIKNPTARLSVSQSVRPSVRAVSYPGYYFVIH